MTTITEARRMVEDLVEMGECGDADEAAHMLVDMGEIDSTTHAELLSTEERQRVYGD